jgi:glycosyltransferase involved in cell wall biosynthesis
MNSPVVSIFMPVFNGRTFLSETLNSIAGQTFRDFELVVVDDGSTDGTPAIVQEAARSDPRIRLIAHQKNLGLSAARNTGIAFTDPRSPFLMNHDADDVSLPRKLEQLVKFLQEHPSVAAVGSFAEYIDERGTVVGSPPIEWKPRNIRATMGDVNSMLVSAALVRREVFASIGEFRSEFGACDDYEFWTRALLADFVLANVPHVLTLIRVHSSSLGSTRKTEMAAIAKEIGAHYRAHQRFTLVDHALRLYRNRLRWIR